MTSALNLPQLLSGSKRFIVFVFALFCFVGVAQQTAVSHFIVHKVKKKETLAAIAKRYDITTEQIISYNPFAQKGIRKRDKLNIPRYKKVVEITSEPKLGQYVVKPKETLWRVAYTYGISIDSLRVLNPQLGDTLSIGTVLYVPHKSAEEKADQFRYYTVQPREGYYRIQQKLGLNREVLEALNPELLHMDLQSGMVLKIPKTQADTLMQQNFRFEAKSSLWDSTFVTPVVRIALMAPFRLSRIELDSVIQTEKTLSERNLTTVALDFYAGMLHATDSLNKAGLSVEFTVFDTENQRHIIEQILNQNDFSQFDAVIGPFTPANVSRVAQALTFFNVPVVSPLTTRDFQSYRTSFNTIPSKNTLNQQLSIYIDSLDVTTENPCILIISDEKNRKTELKLKAQFPLAEIIRPDADFGYVKPDVVDSLLTPTRQNWVFLETEDSNLVISMTSMLNAQQREDRQIQLFTHYRSATYDDTNVSQAHLGNLRFTYPSYFHEKHDSTRVKFDEGFKNHFGKIPNRTAVKGFDVMIDVALRIAVKRTLTEGVSLGLLEQLQHRFDYQPKPAGGYENTATYTIQHQGFEMIEVRPPKRVLDSLEVR
jgi:LysM repeat protein